MSPGFYLVTLPLDETVHHSAALPRSKVTDCGPCAPDLHSTAPPERKVGPKDPASGQMAPPQKPSQRTPAPAT